MIAAPIARPISAGTLQRLLKQHAFFKNMPDAVFNQAQRYAHEVECGPATTILQHGDTSPYAWFLVEGSVSLAPPRGEPHLCRASDPDAGYPIANLRPCRYTVTTTLKSRLIRFEQSYLKRLAQPSKATRFSTANTQGGGSWQSHPFAVEVVRMQQQGEFKIPAMPGISTRINQAMSDANFAATDMAKLISADPAIAGRLISMANSALFKRHEACQSLQAAVIRLGLQQTRNLVTVLATKGLFAGQQSWIKQPLQATWRHAVDIAAYAAVLADLTPHINREQLLLLGLLHELGAVPILEQALKFPSLQSAPGIIDAVLSNLAPELTAITLQKWDLPEFADAVKQQENWHYDGPGKEGHSKVNPTDVLIVAHLHQRMKAKNLTGMPGLDEIPAFQKMAALGLTANVGVTILEEAKQELAELRALLA